MLLFYGVTGESSGDGLSGCGCDDLWRFTGREPLARDFFEIWRIVSCASFTMDERSVLY